jgi:hypothetical protein
MYILHNLNVKNQPHHFVKLLINAHMINKVITVELNIVMI